MGKKLKIILQSHFLTQTCLFRELMRIYSPANFNVPYFAKQQMVYKWTKLLQSNILLFILGEPYVKAKMCTNISVFLYNII